MKPIQIAFSLVGAISLFAGCTKLDEKLNGSLTLEEAQKAADINGLLAACYSSFREPYQNQTGIFCLQDMSTDDCIGPTRGGDWDDNGVWRVLHTQTWGPTNARIADNFNNLSQVNFNCTNILTFAPPPPVAAEALMLRAYALFSILDLYDQVPFRDPGEDLLKPSRVLKGTAALDQIIKDLNEAMPNLTDGPAYKGNKWAAKTLLMKCYLNKGVYTNRLAPTFDAADMDKVIALGTEIVNSGKFDLEDKYFTSFIPTNTQSSKEIIFANENQDVPNKAGNIRFHWFCGTHYNQNPSGWNGFTTLASFYDLFEPTDQRRGVAWTGFTDKTGMRVGLLEGQQYDATGNKLKDRSGNDLVFGRDISPIVTGNVELPGIRVVKYVPDMKDDFTGSKDNANNDYVLLRYSDVLLMQAEAYLRKGNAAAALLIVNEVRAKRGASLFTTIDNQKLLDERGRELYWESWRRNDLVRFGKFLDPFGPTKPTKSDNKYIIFPIPANAIAVNPNLQQNSGY